MPEPTTAAFLLSQPVIRGLTLWQPYATLIAVGAKQYETRSWPAPDWLIGKPLLIHAAKRFDDQVLADVHRVRRVLFAANEYAAPDHPAANWSWGETLGSVLAVAVLDACEPAVGQYTDLEKQVGDFGPDRYAWRLRPVHSLVRPAPWKGAQGLWTVPQALRAAVRAALE